MAHRYVHIAINFGLGFPQTNALEPWVRMFADDWMRFTPTNWVVWTTKSNADIAATLRGALTLNDQFVLFEIHPMNRDGMHYEWVWAWLNEPRPEGYRPPTPLPPPSPFLPTPRLPPKKP